LIRALVPAKALVEAKGRLATALTEQERRALALAMLTDVVTALKAVAQIDSVHVVSPDDEVRELAARLGATPVAESANVRGINQALNRAVSIMSPPPDALVIVLADVPEIEPADVEAVLRALPERGIAICPSEDKGTTLLALRPPNVIPFRFGDRSFSLHKREAAAQGIPAEVLRLPSLSHDIDSAEDLWGLAGRPGDTETHRLLARLGLTERVG
jgi:2-phospho-L-lactate guanylyltransferase